MWSILGKAHCINKILIIPFNIEDNGQSGLEATVEDGLRCIWTVFPNLFKSSQLLALPYEAGRVLDPNIWVDKESYDKIDYLEFFDV